MSYWFISYSQWLEGEHRGFYWASRYFIAACTQELWKAVMGNNPSDFKSEQLPVETISWEDCIVFCNKPLKKLV